MDNSYISYSKHGTVFVGNDATRLFQAAVLSSCIGLLSKGIRASQGFTLTKALAAATKFTGKHYKRTEFERARADLKVWIETMKSALPTETH